ncbi:hypothetical protein APHAL10511_002331 [Amanita phalloides]|nr:hypothetical protein APHAL10511_002331 [Amanita phalloides]
MPSFFATIFHGLLRAGTQAPASILPIPGLVAVSELLSTVVLLCESVPQNRSAARRLAERCQQMYKALEQYENTPIPNRTSKPRNDVFECLHSVKDTMKKWSEKSWLQMLLHQGEFETEIDDCGVRIFNCLFTFTTAANLEVLAHRKEDEKWKRDLKESLDADRIALVKELSGVNFVQRAMEDRVIESQNDCKQLLDMMQKHLAQNHVSSKEEHDRMASNLYDLLRLTRQLPPDCQLDSGEVIWTDQVPVAGSKNVDIYKGRYLNREDVMIKVIRSIKKDEKSIERIRREIELWMKIYELDQGKHIIPFYGFCTSDGVRLALVSPWIDNGDAMTYVKRHDRLVNYRGLIRGIAEGIQVLHSMDPPIIHGDLKADKVFIGDQGQPLLTDFALAKLEGNQVTQTVGLSDAYRWSAPEMCMDPATVSTKSDIYSFGMTILELLTHEKPYADLKRGAQVIKKIDKGELPGRPQDGRAIERGLDDRMWELLRSCWSMEPENRPSIEDLVTQLRNLSRWEMYYAETCPD